MDSDSKWNFEAPKFWDLSETTKQGRPNDSWFTKRNISAASFGTSTRKRRALRVMSFDHKPNKPKPVRVPDETVFDRLARESTISFSNKMVVLPTAAETTTTTEAASELRREQRKSMLVQKNPIKERVATFFTHLIQKNAPKKKALLERKQRRINDFFHALIQRNKSLYETKQLENVKQQVIAVKYFDQRLSMKRKRSITSTLDGYKRAKTELTRSKERTSILMPK
ncbi:uncharacterized protein EV154DRAFT_526478 [Mucor mucedo]|uniref:uncharacterized protein n=1 Tax=Mucor mucedo TaxID=29922 RepID=UPI00221E77C5|nr:uncharacterized protein EV154DRAFT_526478 [Mucor mucedo]KAI7875750.1 hypothetical protein EV154DRAFT_526478 [Mucor mucedo]